MRYSVLTSGMALVTLVVAFMPPPAFGQGQIVVKQDVVYGRTAGSALMADIAYPVSEEPVPAMIYVHGGRWDNARSDVRAVISAAAPYELNTLSWGNLWTPIDGNVEEQRRIASPIHQINADTKPILIIHSDDDRSVPVQQAHDMAAAMDSAGAPYKFVHYTDRGHMRITEEVTSETLAFIADLGGP